MDSEGDSQDPFSMSVGESILRKYNYRCSICLNFLIVAGSECVDVIDSAKMNANQVSSDNIFIIST
jgi:hypothetical protein